MAQSREMAQISTFEEFSLILRDGRGLEWILSERDAEWAAIADGDEVEYVFVEIMAKCLICPSQLLARVRKLRQHKCKGII